MKRSRQVAAPLLAYAACRLLSGCCHPDMQRCIDKHNAVVSDDRCQNTSQDVPDPEYRSYYGGNGGPELGALVSDGSFTPVAGHAYAVSAAETEYGGFGVVLCVAAGAATLAILGAGG